MKKIALFLAIAAAALACKPEETVTPEVKVLSDAADLVIAQDGSEPVYIDFEANVDWTAELKDASAADWCTITPKEGKAGEGKVRVLAGENTTNDNRVAVVVIKAQSAQQEVTVTQLQKNALVAGATALEVAAEGGEVKVTLSHNVDYEVEIEGEWLTQATTKALTETELVFNAAANPALEERVAKITITAGDLKQEVTVTQAAFIPEIELSATELWIAVEGGTAELTVTANFDCDVTVDSDWLTVSNEGDVYTFTAVANPGFEYRAVEVVIEGWSKEDDPATKDVNEAQKFYVFQNGRASVKWEKNVKSDWGWELTNTAFRFAIKDDYILLANSSNQIRVFKKNDGSFVMDFTLPESMIVNTLTNDDAGNVIFFADIPFGGKTNVYYVSEVSANVEPKILGEVSNLNVYGSTAGNFRVSGDVTKDAVISGFCAVQQYSLAFEVKDGVIGGENFGQSPEGDKAIWENRNAVVYPLGASLADGLIFTGYTKTYDIYHSADGGKNWTLIRDSGTEGGLQEINSNDIANAIDVVQVGDRKYMAVGIGAIFRYTAARVIVYDITDMTNVTKVGTWYLPDASSTVVTNGDYTVHGQGADVALEVAEDGLYIYFASAGNQRVDCVFVK